MHDLYSFLKPQILLWFETQSIRLKYNKFFVNIAEVSVNRVPIDSHLIFTTGEISCNIYSYLMAELRPFRFVGPVWLLGFANLDLPSA